MKNLLVTGCFFLIYTTGWASEVDVQAVLDCSAANGPEKTFRQTAHFATYHADGSKRDLHTTIIGARHDNSLGLNIHVYEPTSMAGTVVLFKEQDGQDMTRIYLPSIMRAQNVSGSMAATKLLGTDFTYLDVKNLYGSFVEGESTYKQTIEFIGKPAHEIAIVPAPEEESPYSELTTYIDKQTCVVLGVHFKSEDGTVLKTLEADPDSVTQLEERHLVSHYTMSDILNSSKTTVELGKIVFDGNVAKSVFHPQMFMGAAK